MKAIGSAFRLVAIVLACCGAASACGNLDADSGVVSGVAVSDSSGVRLVRFDDLAALPVPERSATVIAEAGRQQGGELYQVSAARFLEGGRLAVGNSGTSEVLYFDAAGRLEGRVGREGDGPGEYGAITAFVDVVADTLTLYDVRRGRLTVLDPGGEVVRTLRLEPPSRSVDLLPLTLDDRGRVLAIHGDSRIFGMSGVRQDTVPLMVIDSAMHVDTIGLWPGKQWSFAALDRGAFRAAVGFTTSVEASGGDGRAVVGSTERLALTVVGTDGAPMMRVEATGPNRPVPEADVARWRDGRLGDLAEEIPAGVRTAIENLPHNPTFPAFDGLLLDADGRIWVGAYQDAEAPDRTWTVLAPDGMPAFRVVLPLSAKPLDASGDIAAVLVRSELDEEVLTWIELGPVE